MPAIVRTSDKPYRWKIGVAPLERVANVEKKLPRDFITADGYGITAKARRYLSPLVRGEDYPPFKDGLPRLRAAEERRGAEEAGHGVRALIRAGAACVRSPLAEPRIRTVGSTFRTGRWQNSVLFRLPRARLQRVGSGVPGSTGPVNWGRKPPSAARITKSLPRL